VVARHPADQLVVHVHRTISQHPVSPGFLPPTRETAFRCPAHVVANLNPPPRLSYGAVACNFTGRSFMGQYYPGQPPIYLPMKLGEFTANSETAIVAERDNNYETIPFLGPFYYTFHHGSFMNLLYADGRAGKVTKEEFDRKRLSLDPLFYDPRR